jgi:hypothetical protein
MTPSKKKPNDLVKISKSSIVALITPKIRGKNLFPRKIEEGKKILDRARLVR